jgi:hypothetical protein
LGQHLSRHALRKQQQECSSHGRKKLNCGVNSAQAAARQSSPWAIPLI